MRVLHILAPAPFGGLESIVRSLAAEQKRAGFDVHVGAIVDALPHPFVAATEACGITVHALAVPPRSYKHELRLVRSLCRNIQPDVVHTHGYRADVLHGSAARRLNIPWVTTSHGFTGGNWKNRLYERLQRRAFRRCNAVVAVSRPMATQLKKAGVAEDRLYCIPNAWAGEARFIDRNEARRRLGVDIEIPCIGFIGRLGFEKGPDIFIRGMALLDTPPVKAVLVGDGALRSSLVSLTAELGISSSITFAGQVEGAGRLIRAFDAVVLSSRTEGTPVVLLEAMAAQVPVIAARVGGIPDVVSEREAWLTDAERPEALATAIRAALQNPAEALQRATRAAERLAADFSAQRWLDRYEDVYRSCTRSN